MKEDTSITSEPSRAGSSMPWITFALLSIMLLVAMVSLSVWTQMEMTNQEIERVHSTIRAMQVMPPTPTPAPFIFTPTPTPIPTPTPNTDLQNQVAELERQIRAIRSVMLGSNDGEWVFLFDAVGTYYGCGDKYEGNTVAAYWHNYVLQDVDGNPLPDVVSCEDSRGCAAPRWIPFGTHLRVCDKNNYCTVCTVNDRQKDDFLSGSKHIDLQWQPANELPGYVDSGLTDIKVFVKE